MKLYIYLSLVFVTLISAFNSYAQGTGTTHDQITIVSKE